MGGGDGADDGGKVASTDPNLALHVPTSPTTAFTSSPQYIDGDAAGPGADCLCLSSNKDGRGGKTQGGGRTKNILDVSLEGKRHVGVRALSLDGFLHGFLHGKR